MPPENNNHSNYMSLIQIIIQYIGDVCKRFNFIKGSKRLAIDEKILYTEKDMIFCFGDGE